MRHRGAWLLVVATLSISALASVAWGAGLAITSTPVGANTRVKPPFYPNITSTVSVTYACGFLNLSQCGGGQVNNTDRALVTFNSTIKQSTICSSWTTNVARSGISIDVQINNNAGTTGNDTLSIVAVSGVTCSAGFDFGTWDLGAAGYVTANQLYGTSTFALADPTASPDITITLGGGPANTTNPTLTTGQAATFSCLTELQGATNAFCAPSKARTVATLMF